VDLVSILCMSFVLMFWWNISSRRWFLFCQSCSMEASTSTPGADVAAAAVGRRHGEANVRACGEERYGRSSTRHRPGILLWSGAGGYCGRGKRRGVVVWIGLGGDRAVWVGCQVTWGRETDIHDLTDAVNEYGRQHESRTTSNDFPCMHSYHRW
jgi:hypothetical protein